MKIQDWYCHGLIASWTSHLRTVDGEICSQIPSLTACRANSWHDHRDSGCPYSSGGLQATAFTPATCTAVKTAGRPERFASLSADTPGVAHQRRRHLRTVSVQTLSDAAIAVFEFPSAANSTISARWARRCWVDPARTSRASPARWSWVSAIWSGLVGDIDILRVKRPINPFSLICPTRCTGQRHTASGTISVMAAPPASTKSSLQQRLSGRARERWPELAGIDVKFRGEFAYVNGRLSAGDTLPLMRLRYAGSATRWGFAIYLASKDGYEVAALPTGDLAGAPEDALDTACGLHLNDPTAWT